MTANQRYMRIIYIVETETSVSVKVETSQNPSFEKETFLKKSWRWLCKTLGISKNGQM